VLLTQKPDAIDHLLRSGARSIETSGESGVLFLQELNALRRDNALYARGLEALDARLGLKRATSEGCELVTEMLDQHLQLRKCGYFRTYAV
jgi:hypothetical protein